MTYAVKEIFYTLQGEGALTGRPAVFCRFAGCNLWTGREEDRAERGLHLLRHRFRRHRRHRGRPLPRRRRARRPHRGAMAGGAPARFVVCTGGEPLLQLDPPLIDGVARARLRDRDRDQRHDPAAAGIDWVCVSPKAGAPLVVTSGDELKIVVPQAGLDPLDFAGLDFRRFSVQPMDGPGPRRQHRLGDRLLPAHPQWQLSLQTHKMTGIR